MRYRCVRRSLILLFLATTAQVKAQMEAPKPAPEVKKLDFLVGTWTLEGDSKPGPMGPGGKVTMTEHNEWMDGGFFLVSHSEFKSAMGNGTVVSVLGYDPDAKVYTYDEYNSMGVAEHSKGTLNGDTWTWTSDEKMAGQPVHGRFTMKVLSPSSYTFKFEMSTNGSDWDTVMDGKATKGT
jgi:hypothetical protein